MKIFVEGKTDRVFLELYFKYLKINIKELNIIIIEGKDNLANEKQLEKMDEKFLIIFDADKNFDNSKKNIQKQINKLNKNAEYEIFLFPNNKDNGNLETLYAEIATNAKFIDCFEKYKKCINQQLSDKSKIYAYLEACGLETNYKKIKSNYMEKAFNLKDNYIKPLEKFLLENLGNLQ